MKYSSLVNVQSCYNFLKSVIKPEDYVGFLQKNEIKVGFYSDLYSMYGAAEFAKLASSRGVKPIIGAAFDVSFGRIILYAKNNKGFKRISYLSSSVLNEDKIDLQKLEQEIFTKAGDDVFVIFISSVENLDNYKDKLKKVFNDNLFFGITKTNFHFFKNESNLIFANEVNYLYEDDYFQYKVLRAIGEAKLLTETENIEKNFYVSNAQMQNYIDVQKHNENISKIIEQVEDDVINDNQVHFIKFKDAKNDSSSTYIEKLCKNKLVELGLSENQQYSERLVYELEVIKKMGFEDYFLIVSDMINAAEEKNILVGPGRGSASGSLVSYLLNITKLDPIKWDLLFERFLNVDRITLPDIDIDFEDERREEVLEYLYKKYGREHFATITTFQTIGIKNAIRDCGRVFDLPNDDVTHMTRLIGDKNVKDLDKALEESRNLTKYKEKYPQVFEVIKKIIGLPRQTGTHAAGVVFCDVPLWEVVPTKVGINGILQTQFSMNFLEEIGLIKTDILGLRNLSIIQQVISSVEKLNQTKIDLKSLPLNDKDTFELLRNRQTSGIFQLESQGMTEVLTSMKVNSIEDIAVTSALFRPGPQENIPTYIARKNDNNREFSIDKSLTDILGDTYGIIVYQEQVMKILQKVANFELSKADIVRRAIGKKDQKLMAEFKKEFVQGALENKYNEGRANELWHYIEKFAEYGFNKSHAIAYSIISYWMAYLKTHFKAEFYCALLNGSIKNEVKTSQYLYEIKTAGIRMNGPSIKNPNSTYYYGNQMINMPLNVIKGIGQDLVKTIRAIHKKAKNAFESFAKVVAILVSEGLTDKKFEALAYAGAFDAYGYSRKDLANNQKEIFNLAQILKYSSTKDLEVDLPIKKDKPELIASYEKEFFGFYVTTHPLSIFRQKMLNSEKLLYLSSLQREDITCDVFVTVDNIVTKTDKNGGQMCFLDVSDETGSIMVTIFASTFEKIKSQIEISQNIIIKVKTQLYNNKISALLIDFKKTIK
ncbi:DNA polymerase III subunit alpha [Spiroplasma chinense]|uniref:DNA-directed DNA polymerase n=1 Tax=Spiroplasma chinense TaxID=216932 RepID=A0A5B9Y5I4_9MOLU|nr:DNA polymerase III subunit alpha [Spiroplasma chinense]QEH62210.1 DNA polymerase III subunit alpha [Spiroplasma chinense]